MYHAMYLTMALCVSGGVGVLEHPSVGHWIQNCASVWKTLEMQLMFSATCFLKYSFKQSDFRQCGIKPTTLCVLRLPDLPIAFHSIRQRNYRQGLLPLSVHALKGIDEEGRFRTHAAKEYPSDMCEALAVSFVNGLVKNDRDRPDDNFDPWNAYHDAFVPSDFYHEHLVDACIPNDFASATRDF